MIDQKKRMYPSEAFSLLTLKLMLTEAKEKSPPQTRKDEQSDEELALKLIAGMKKSCERVGFTPAPLKTERSSTVSMKKVNVLEP